MKSRRCLQNKDMNACPLQVNHETNLTPSTKRKFTRDNFAKDKESTTQLLMDKPLYSVHSHDSFRGGATHYPYECPVEIQTREALHSNERDQEIKKMEAEFMAKRKIYIAGLPHDCTEEILKSVFRGFSCVPVSKIKDGTVRVLFSSAAKAKDSLALLNSTMFKCQKLSASYGHADSLLFVGNLPFTYTRDDLASLFRPYGDILRCLIVLSPKTGLSKGYGFVEYSKREEALVAKQQLATKVIGLRSLRVDFSDNGMQTCEDLHSQTLFVDRLPKGFKKDDALQDLFSQYGRVNFCQVAISETGTSRGFAFIDMSTSQEAECAQLSCNGYTFLGQDMRVSFGMPCRHGACILQHKFFFPLKGDCKFSGTFLPLLSSCSAPNLTNQFCQQTDINVIAQSYSDSCLQVAGHHHIIVPLSERDAETKNFSTEYHQVSNPKNNCISKSQSAPSVLCTQSNGQFQQDSTHLPTMYSDMYSNSHTEKFNSLRHLMLGKKRPLSLSPCVYDKAFIGQHQQGIPFTHPLKRIKMED